MKGNNSQHNKKHNHTIDEGRNSLNTNLNNILHNKPIIVNMTEVDNNNENSKNIISKPYYLRGNSANSRYNKHNKHIANKQNDYYQFTNSNNNNNNSNYGNGGNNNNNNNIRVNLIKPQYDNSNSNTYSSQTILSPFNKTYTQSYLPTIRTEDDVVSNNKKPKTKKLSIEHGVTYKTGNGYKYYFHIPSMELYLLYEIKFTDIGNLIQRIDEWNTHHINNSLYLHITQTLINVPEGYITIVIEQPLGERIVDILESTGFMNENFITTITKQLLDNYSNDSINNVCICDLYFDIYEKVKIIPSFITEQIKPKKQCTCKFMLDILSKNLNFNVNNNKYMHIGLIILKLMIGNLNLDILNYIILKVQNTSTSKTFMKMKKCCLMHLLFDIEHMYLQSTSSSYSSSHLTLKNIITNVYSDSFIKLLCCLLSFDTHNKQVNYISKYISILSHMSYNRVYVSMKELLKVVKLKHETYINDFINRLFFVLSSLSGNIANSSDSTALSKEFVKRLNEKKCVLFFLSYMFDVDKEEFVERIEVKLVKKSSIGGNNKYANGISDGDSKGKKKKVDNGVNGQEVC